jgi:hypothetical protein
MMGHIEDLIGGALKAAKSSLDNWAADSRVSRCW